MALSPDLRREPFLGSYGRETAGLGAAFEREAIVAAAEYLVRLWLLKKTFMGATSMKHSPGT